MKGIHRIETRRFFLRALNISDVSNRYLGWLQGKMVRDHIVYARQPQTLQTLMDYVAAREGREDAVFLGIFSRNSEEHIGNIKYEPIDRILKVAVMGILIGERKWQGKGVAAEVINASALYMAETCGIECLELGVDSNHKFAIRAYTKLGFKPGPTAVIQPTKGSLGMVKYLRTVDV